MRYTRWIVFLCQYNCPKTSSSDPLDIPRTRIALSSRCIARECRLSYLVCTAYFNGSLELQEHRLRKEYLFGFNTKGANLTFQKFAFFGSLIEQFVDDLVHINLIVLVHDFEFDILN